MQKLHHEATYLFNRSGIWYFRFRLPSATQSGFRQAEIRLSLSTGELRVARERVAVLLPYVYWLKRFGRRMKELSRDQARAILDEAFTRIVNELERTKEPWMRNDPSQDSVLRGLLPDLGPSPLPTPKEQLARNAGSVRSAILNKDHGRMVKPLRQKLNSIGCEIDESSPQFKRLCLDLLKLEGMYLEARWARFDGNYTREEEFIDYYKRNGYSILPSISRATGTGPTISEAWRTYFKEKTTARPKTDWTEKTARGCQATFDEFKSVVGDLRVRQISRDLMLDYLDKVSRLPKNRNKLYPDKTIQDLLAIDVPEQQLPSSRTIAEKLVQLGAFFKWCRITKRYLENDPTEGINIKASSRSYAPFTDTDLGALFRSKDYCENKHRSSWQFWVPLLALYTGARQNEIAQLRVADIAEEDGFPLIGITDYGEGQKIKTEAGIRKVPISSQLIALGFLEYVEFLKEIGHERVFPDLPKGSQSWGRKISRWFNNTYKVKCGIQPDSTGARKVFHSFRHTAITKAIGKGMPIQHCQQVFGHEQSILGETATYTHEFPPSAVSPVIDALDWGLDHSSYSDAWQHYADRIA